MAKARTKAPTGPPTAEPIGRVLDSTAKLLSRAFDQQLAGASSASGADGFVVPLCVGGAVRDVTKRAVRQLGDERVTERRVAFDGKTQFDKDLSGQ